MSHAKHFVVNRRAVAVAAAVLLALSGVAVARSVATNIRLGRTSFGLSYIALRLQNGHHLPIYISTNDPRNKSRCFGNCAATFAPVIARGTLKAWGGVRRKLLGIINRGHGVMQVTYKHHPLYVDPYDTPGVASEDGCQLFGSDWYVVDRNGNPDKRFQISCGY